ncbi:MAG TPA: extracellular solute-binding protein [Solirubrobacteraceae bacterium]|nr:extracellular solute-binding protein [Solirubrobacteraceae bacterium]
MVLAGCGSSGKGPVALNWYVFPEPSGSFATAAANCSKASGGAYTIKISFLSTQSDGQRVALVRRLAANDSSIDILAMDVDWTAEFADAKWIRPVPAGLASQIRSQDLAGPVQTASYQGRLWAVPINSNTELLWYRKDLVPSAPKTWDQMINDAVSLAKQGKPHYIEEQGAQYEGLTVWFNSMVDSAGGQIITANNKVVIGHSAEVAASIMHRMATSPAADPSLNVAQEGPSDVAFDSGKAAFEINYPFVWQSAKAANPAVAKNMGYALFPEVVPGLPPHVSIGGYNLGISAYSKHADLAFQAAKCLTQIQNQERDAIKGGLAPVAASIYSQPAFVKLYPFASLIKQQLQTYGIRPQTPAYADVTLAIQKALSPTSSINPQGVVSTLRSEIKLSLSSGALL